MGGGFYLASRRCLFGTIRPLLGQWRSHNSKKLGIGIEYKREFLDAWSELATQEKFLTLPPGGWKSNGMSK